MRILVVEDDAMLASALRRGLVAEGYDVDVASSGTTALELARATSFDAFVLDILLPGMSGYRVCATLRAEGVAAPVLMLTAKDGEMDEAEALDTGADDFLRKPFSYEVLLARLRALFRRSASRRGSTLALGDLRLDPFLHQCARGDVEVLLTPREFAVLEYLLGHPGELVTKRELLDHVWDLDFAGDPNIVEAYVSYLRKKIDRPFGRTTIETVRGLGYRIVEGV